MMLLSWSLFDMSNHWVMIALGFMQQMDHVHGDLKPSNILLDADMVAHVGDFGLARLVGTDLNQNSSTGIKGTIGYAPPEYGLGSEMSSIGDVYSFGILLLEVMTGKKPTDNMFNEGLSLHKFAYMALPDHVIDIIDNDVIVLQSTEANAKKVEECLAATIKIGVSCSLDSPPERMQIEMVVIELQRILDMIFAGSIPPLCHPKYIHVDQLELQGQHLQRKKVERKKPSQRIVVIMEGSTMSEIRSCQSMSKLRQCFWEIAGSKLGNILVLRTLQREVDFKGDAKFAQDMKTGAVSDLANSKSLSEQRHYLPLFYVRDDL
nr:protein kinase-like domain-containing protein [Tanacetum cinerariifolium]